MRLRIDLTYDGGGFHGWARQPGLRSVQGDLEAALATILRVPAIRATCAGRTDTGVHARGQVVHVDVPEDVLEPSAPDGRRTAKPRVDDLRRRLNGVLEPDVRVRTVAVAAPGFDARFSAMWRRYAYRIADRPELVDPLLRGHVLTWPRPLDEAGMNAAATILLGKHDFASFCKKRPGATTVRCLLDLNWERESDGLLVATVRAEAFCHNMVRSLIGCMIAVGEGREDPQWVADVLGARQRHPAVKVVHPHGLTLEEVHYAPDDELAEQARLTRAVRTLDDPEDS